MTNIKSNKVENEEKIQEQESNQKEPKEYIVLEAFQDATYYKGKVESELESRVIKFGNQPTGDGIVPDVRLHVRRDVDKQTLLRLLNDLSALVEAKVETDFVSEQNFDPPYGIFTFPYPDLDDGALMIYADNYFCTCSAEFYEPCPCEETENVSGYGNVIV